MPDKDPELTRLFVRDLDDIVLPARGTWRPAPRRGSALMNATRFALAATAVAAVLVLALIASFGLRDNTPVAAPQTSSPTPTSSPSASATASSSVTPSASSSPARTTSLPNASGPTGTITGRLGYPSDFVPPLTVYAISVSDPNVWFSTSTPRFGNPLSSVPPGPTWPPSGPGTYLITGVAPGTYYVIAYRNDDTPQSSFPGAYTERARKCLSSDPNTPSPPPGPCSNDQTLVQVTVRAGDALRYIDIVDWIFQSGTYPPRPTPR